MTSLRTSSLIALAAIPVVMLSMQACGSDDAAPPATTMDAATDTRSVKDTGPTSPTTPLKVLVGGEDVDADLSCMGKGAPDAGVPTDAGVDGGPSPMVGDLVDMSFKVLEFGGGGSDIVVGAEVDLFYKNTLLMGEPEVVKAKTDDKGIAVLKVPFGKTFTYRVNPNTNLRTFVYFDSDPVTKLTGNYELTAITKSKYDQFALAITGKTGFLTAANTGIYSARVQDCQGRQISNAVVQLVDAASGAPLPTGPGDTDLKEIHYLSDQDLPSTGRYWTSRSALVAAINVPETKAGAKAIKAIAKGLYSGSSELRKFAEADLEITASAVNFRTIAVK